jgi:hypothetical protein
MASLTVKTIQKLKFRLFPHPAYISYFVPSGYTFSDPSEMHYMDTDLQMMERSRMQCILGFMCSQ